MCAAAGRDDRMLNETGGFGMAELLKGLLAWEA